MGKPELIERNFVQSVKLISLIPRMNDEKICPAKYPVYEPVKNSDSRLQDPAALVKRIADMLRSGPTKKKPGT